MVSAFVFIKTRAGKASQAAKELERIAGCKMACLVTGRFDIVLLLEANDLKTLAETILSKIHAVDGVESTETAIVV